MKRIIKLLLLLNLSILLLIPDKVDAIGNKVAVHFLDVGQADCIFVEVNGGKNMLIDAGNNKAGNKIVYYLQRLGIEKIDYVIATHPHHDHIGSLDKVIENFKIGKLYTSNVTNDTTSFYDTLKAVKKYKVNLKNVKGKKKLKLANDVKVYLYGPLLNKYASINEQSIVIKMIHNEKTFLFMADAGIPVEKKLIAKDKDIKADVLKVGHHGANSASSLAFIKKVKPKIAVISVGQNNKFDFPTSETLKNLNKVGAEIFRTDNLGTITAFSDGKKILWFTSKYGFIYP